MGPVRKDFGKDLGSVFTNEILQGESLQAEVSNEILIHYRKAHYQSARPEQLFLEYQQLGRYIVKRFLDHLDYHPMPEEC